MKPLIDIIDTTNEPNILQTMEFHNTNPLTPNPMKTIEHNLHIGSKLYWTDAPEILAGVVVRFTDKRDVVINFVSGNEQGEKHYPIKLAKRFISKP